MKKALLFGTTALVAAGLYASPAFAQSSRQGEEGALVVGISGFARQYVQVQDNNDEALNYVDQWGDTEIIFTGETQVIGGLEVGVNVQLEGETDRGDIDESFVYLEGAFGRLVLGSENSAAYLMHYAAPNVTGFDIDSGDTGNAIIGAAQFGLDPRGATYLEAAGESDGQKITYFTPRFSGFQLGVSVLPDITGGGAVNQIDSATAAYDWGATAGANYVQNFENFNVAASVGVVWADSKDDRFVDLDGDDLEDYFGYSAGLNVGFQGFTVGGSVAQVTTEDVFQEGIAWGAGVSYAQDRYAVSVSYFDNDMEVEDFEYWAVVGGGSYRLGTGVNVVGYVGYSETECDTIFNGAAPNCGAGVRAGTIGAKGENDGAFGGVGLEVSF